MKLWQKYSEQANSAFANKDYQKALEGYLAALDRTKKLFPHWFDIEEAAVALAISHQNLADLYLTIGKDSEAFTLYRDLLKCFTHFCVKNPAKKHLIEKVRRHTITELMAAINKSSIPSIQKSTHIEEIMKLTKPKTIRYRGH